MLYSADADVVMSAHDHLYERYAPQDPNGAPDPRRGITQFVAGTGGSTLYQVASLQPNSEARISAYGVLKMTLRADAYEWEFISVSGARDTGTRTCH